MKDVCLVLLLYVVAAVITAVYEGYAAEKWVYFDAFMTIFKAISWPVWLPFWLLWKLGQTIRRAR